MWNKIEKSENEDIPNAYQFYFSTTGSRFSSLQKVELQWPAWSIESDVLIYLL